MSVEKNQQTEQTLQVDDPEDYNRTQRFREIHQARGRVADFVADIDIPNRNEDFFVRESVRLGYLVSLYIYELEPLIEQSDYATGDLISDDIGFDSLQDFAANMGEESTDDGTQRASVSTAMQVYSAANRFYAKVGLELELKEQTNQTKITDDMIEEVEQWRQSNI
jgi:hypothetical protein